MSRLSGETRAVGVMARREFIRGTIENIKDQVIYTCVGRINFTVSLYSMDSFSIKTRAMEGERKTSSFT